VLEKVISGLEWILGKDLKLYKHIARWEQFIMAEGQQLLSEDNYWNDTSIYVNFIPVLGKKKNKKKTSV